MANPTHDPIDPVEPTEEIDPHDGPPSHAAGWLRVFERSLFVVGLACVVFYAAACAQRALFQSTESDDFDHEIARALQLEEHDKSDWSASRVTRYEAISGEPTHTLGRLEIPAANVSVMVLEGTDAWTLNRAVGHIEGTARPGEGGNLGIAGHRDSFFRGLQHMNRDDEMQLSTLEGVTHYRVTDIRIVEPREVEVLAPSEESSITLVTCYPFYYVGAAPKRYIVRGEEVRFEPWTRERLAQYAPETHGPASIPAE